ncbi:hypothetical protein DCS_06957 [Drechmeria coniospora]|uniref:Serine peptidase n=1 Tax=Drechmeria coniospora TaxID=98403 RepID=A0A151GD23_DRECN|nr:hypothetical protein DCS_06957 [Drechmeria coniospora]KYK54996.1 hypothetical protein DCS_06957 [Drechmeria coniospora]
MHSYSVLAAALTQLLLVTSASGAVLPGSIVPDDSSPSSKHVVRRDEDKKVVFKMDYFIQLINHDDPPFGYFKQRYWWNDEHYKGKGSPIILKAPSEGNGEDDLAYLTNDTLLGQFAEAVGGAIIVLEHRYWGKSSPYPELTAETLQYLNVGNATADLVYFARNVFLDFDKTQSSRPSKAPWVLSGASYSGALAAWTNAIRPGTFWAYHCSSATVQALPDMSDSFNIAEAAMPRNCSADFQKMIKHVDDVLTKKNYLARKYLKNQFGLGAMDDDNSFAAVLALGPLRWQGAQFYTGYTELHRMCDYVENQWPGSTSNPTGAEGVGLHKALEGYGRFFQEVIIPENCDMKELAKNNDTASCFSTDNVETSPVYSDLSVDNTMGRQWRWLSCNEPLESWMTGGPNMKSGIVSTLFTSDSLRSECEQFFPTVNNHTYGLAKNRTADDLNALTGGWDPGNAKRVMWVNGEYDMWRPATVSSQRRTGKPLESVYLIPKGMHASDIFVLNGQMNPEVGRIQRKLVSKMTTWVDEFYTKAGRQRPSRR